MDYRKIPLKKYECTSGNFYQLPKINKQEEDEILRDLEFRATFQDFSNEFKGTAVPKDFT